MNKSYLKLCTALLASLILTSSFIDKESIGFAYSPQFVLPCGFINKHVLPAPNSNSYIYTSNFPILSKTGTWTRSPYVPMTIPKEINKQGIKFVLQGDGNLVIYYGSRSLWSTRTAGSAGSYLFFQSNGNLVLTSDAYGQNVVWSSGIYSTCAGSDQARFILQSDGNLIMTYPQDPSHDIVLGDTGSGDLIYSPHQGTIK